MCLPLTFGWKASEWQATQVTVPKSLVLNSMIADIPTVRIFSLISRPNATPQNVLTDDFFLIFFKLADPMRPSFLRWFDCMYHYKNLKVSYQRKYSFGKKLNIYWKNVCFLNFSNRVENEKPQNLFFIKNDLTQRNGNRTQQSICLMPENDFLNFDVVWLIFFLIV